jgi:hypothetical protein
LIFIWKTTVAMDCLIIRTLHFRRNQQCYVCCERNCNSGSGWVRIKRLFSFPAAVFFRAIPTEHGR